MVNIINIFSSVAAVLLIISGSRVIPKIFYPFYFLLVSFFDYICVGFEFALMIRILIGSFILFVFLLDMIETVFSIVMAEFCILCIVLIIASIAYLIPDFLQTIAFNLLMSGTVVFVACMIRIQLIKYRNYIAIIPGKIMAAVTLAELITVLPLSIVAAKSTSTNQLFLILSIFLVNTLVIVCLIICLLKLMIKQREDELREGAKIQKQLIDWNIRKQSHFTTPMLSLLRKHIDQDDIHGIRNLYETYIGPINNQQTLDINLEKLKLIKMGLIHDFLYDLVLRHPNVELCIEEVFDASWIVETDLFVVIAEYINNALSHTEGHSDGLVRVSLSMATNKIASIEIANTFYGNSFDVKDIIEVQPRINHTGFGLDYIRKVMKKNNWLYSTYVRGNMFVQYLEV